MDTPEKNNNEVNNTPINNNEQIINNETSPNGDEKTSPTGDSATLADITETHKADYQAFDPAIHAVNPDGTPRLKASGEFALKRGRGSKSASAVSRHGNADKTVAGVVESSVAINIDEASRQSANMVINMCVWTLGEEVGRPFDRAEAEGLKMSFRNYYESRGVPDIPPEVGLMLALGSYVAPRLYHEKSKPRLQRIKEKLAFWFTDGKR